MFEAKYPFKLAKENKALVFNLNFPEDYKITNEILYNKSSKTIDLSKEEFKLD